MTIIGPFWRRKPSTATTGETWAWCYVWLDMQGHTVAIEWRLIGHLDWRLQ